MDARRDRGRGSSRLIRRLDHIREIRVRLFALLTTIGGMLFAAPMANAGVGAVTVGASVDSNPPGLAQDYRAEADASGSVDRLNVFLDGASTAASVELGLYQSASSSTAGSL